MERTHAQGAAHHSKRNIPLTAHALLNNPAAEPIQAVSPPKASEHYVGMLVGRPALSPEGHPFTL